MKDDIDDTAFALWLGLFVIVIIAMISGVAFLKETESCEQLYGGLGKPKTKYTPLVGCFIQQSDGTWAAPK